METRITVYYCGDSHEQHAFLDVMAVDIQQSFDKALQIGSCTPWIVGGGYHLDTAISHYVFDEVEVSDLQEVPLDVFQVTKSPNEIYCSD